MRPSSLIPAILLASAAIADDAARLVVSDFRVEREPQQFTVALRAEARGGATIGRFHVYVPQSSVGRSVALPGFDNGGRFPTLVLTDAQSTARSTRAARALVDRDPRPGHLEVTISTKDWPVGVYRLVAGVATPRDAPGRMHDEKPFVIVIGDPRPNWPTGNVPGAVHSVVYLREGVYAAFPSLVVTRDGTLYTTFSTRVRATHTDRTGGSVTMKSVDGGITWREASPRAVFDRSWYTAGGMLVLPELEKPIELSADEATELKDEGKDVFSVRPGVFGHRSGARARASADEGRSWRTIPITVPNGVTGLTNYVRAAAFTRASTGFYYAVYGRRGNGGTASRAARPEVFIIRADPSGQEWTMRPMFPDGLPRGAPGLTETALLEVEPGRLLAVMRTDKNAEMYSSLSKDGGTTWSTPVSTGVWGFPPHLLALSDGRILLTYGYRRNPMGIRAVISDDGGQTWNTENTLILRADGFYRMADLGYPVTTETADGTLLTIYYFTTFDSGGVTHIAATRWKPPSAR